MSAYVVLSERVKSSRKAISWLGGYNAWIQ